MQVEISLNKISFDLWFLRSDSKIALTIEEPGPIKLEFDNLMPTDQLCIIDAINKHILLSSTGVEDLHAAYTKKYPDWAKKIISENSETTSRNLYIAIQQRENQILNSYTSIINRNPAAIADYIKDLDDMKILKLMMGLEQNKQDKCRKSVVKLIEDRLAELDIFYQKQFGFTFEEEAMEKFETVEINNQKVVIKPEESEVEEVQIPIELIKIPM